MPSIDPYTILQGPAIITYLGATFYSEGDIEVEEVIEEMTIKASGLNDIEDRVKDRMYKVKFKPAGEWENLTVLFPNYAIGGHLFDSNPLVIWTREGADNKRTYYNAAITKLPSVATGVDNTMLGDIEFTCLIHPEAESGDAGYIQVATETFPAETFDPAAVLTPVINFSLGADTPWTNISTITAPVFDFALNVRPVKVSGRGTISMILTSKKGTVKFTPVGVTEAAVRTLRGADQAMGTRPPVKDVTAYGTGIYIKLNKCQFKGGNLNYGVTKERIGEITGQATQTVTSGTADALWIVDTSD